PSSQPVPAKAAVTKMIQNERSMPKFIVTARVAPIALKAVTATLFWRAAIRSPHGMETCCRKKKNETHASKGTRASWLVATALRPNHDAHTSTAVDIGTTIRARLVLSLIAPTAMRTA